MNVLLPAIDYTAIRLGLGTAINLVEWLSLDVSFAYLPVLGTGALSEARYGDKVETVAWEAGAGALVRFKEVYGVRAGLDFRRYKYDTAASADKRRAWATKAHHAARSRRPWLSAGRTLPSSACCLGLPRDLCWPCGSCSRPRGDGRA
jgi:hypothetical protein